MSVKFTRQLAAKGRSTGAHSAPLAPMPLVVIVTPSHARGPNAASLVSVGFTLHRPPPKGI